METKAEKDGYIKDERRYYLSRRQALTVFGASMFSCRHLSPIDEVASPHDDADSSFSPTEPPLVVLVAIDGVRWQDVFSCPDDSCGFPLATRETGWLPQLAEMEKNGAVLGAPGSEGFHATGPNFVSLPGYMEILSGTSQLTCTENDCPTMRVPTLLDDFQAAWAEGLPPSAVFSSWENLEIAAGQHKVGIASTGRFSGFNLEELNKFPDSFLWLEEGKTNTGGEGNFRQDRVTGQLALSYLEEAAPPFLFVSLGETDEAAHRGDWVGYRRALLDADQFLGRVRAALATKRAQGRNTVLLVTTDHGRANNFRDHGRSYPESSRAFLFAEGDLISSSGRVSSGRAFLKDIAPTVRRLAGLPRCEINGGGRVLHEILS